MLGELAIISIFNRRISRDEALIPEYGGTIAASAFVSRALDPEWATLVF